MRVELQTLMLAMVLFSTGARAAQSLAVFPVAGEDKAAATAVEGMLVDAVRAVPDHDVIAPARMQKTIEKAQRAGVSCSAPPAPPAPACAARVAAIAGVPTSLLAELEGSDKLRLRLLRTEGSSVVRDVAATLSPLVADRARGVTLLVRALLLGEPLASELFVDVDTAGARIFVDGSEVGTSPMRTPLSGVAPGVHRVRVEATGRAPVEREIESLVGAKTTVRVEVGAAPSSAAPLSSPASPLATSSSPPSSSADTGLLVVVGGIVGGASALATAGLLAAAAVVTPAESNRADLTATEFNDRTGLGRALYLGAAAAGAVALAGGVAAGVGVVLE